MWTGPAFTIYLYIYMYTYIIYTLALNFQDTKRTFVCKVARAHQHHTCEILDLCPFLALLVPLIFSWATLFWYSCSLSFWSGYLLSLYSSSLHDSFSAFLCIFSLFLLSWVFFIFVSYGPGFNAAFELSLRSKSVLFIIHVSYHVFLLLLYLLFFIVINFSPLSIFLSFEALRPWTSCLRQPKWQHRRVPRKHFQDPNISRHFPESFR